MSNSTSTLEKLYQEELADIRRVAHYDNPQLDVEEILKRSVRFDAVMDHYNRYQTVLRMFQDGELETGEDFFYASFIFCQEENSGNYALGYIFAQTAKRFGFFGNDEVPNIDVYIEQLLNFFLTGDKDSE